MAPFINLINQDKTRVREEKRKDAKLNNSDTQSSGCPVLPTNLLIIFDRKGERRQTCFWNESIASSSVVNRVCNLDIFGSHSTICFCSTLFAGPFSDVATLNY